MAAVQSDIPVVSSSSSSSCQSAATQVSLCKFLTVVSKPSVPKLGSRETLWSSFTELQKLVIILFLSISSVLSVLSLCI